MNTYFSPAKQAADVAAQKIRAEADRYCDAIVDARKDATCVKYDVPLITGERRLNGHLGVSGLSKHSVGELYPWSAVTIGVGCESGRIECHNLITGKVGPLVFRYDSERHAADPKRYSWEQAHAAAVEWIENHRGIADPTTNQPAAVDVL